MLVQEQWNNLNKDNIINYERKLIESPFDSLPTPTSRNDSKYSVCQLYEKIQELVGDSSYNLRWIGSDKHCHIQAYVYCLLMLSISSNKSMIVFKSIFYELCRKYLDVKQQKLVVEFLCLLQFSSDKYLFIKKYPVIHEIVLSIFNKLQSQKHYQFDLQDQKGEFNQNLKQNKNILYSVTQRNQNQVQNENQLKVQDQVMGLNQLVQVYSKFSKKFNFLKWSKSSESSIIFSIEQNKKMHVLVQKEYVFILQILEESEAKAMKSKLTKYDRIQIQRLLYSSAEPQISLQQKLVLLSQATQKPNQIKQTQLQKFRNHQNSSSIQKKEALTVSNPAHLSYQTSKIAKKDYKFPAFSKKSVNPHQQIQHNLQHKKQNVLKKLEYIDLMQSSFQEQCKTLEIQGLSNSKQQKQSTNQSQNVKYFKPKFIPKSLNQHSDKKNKIKTATQTAVQSSFQSQMSNRSRQPSNVQKKNIAFNNTGQKEKKFAISKQIRFYSPPRLFKESPTKQYKKQAAYIKKQNQYAINQKRKQELKKLDKKYFQKKEQIQNKNKSLNADRLVHVKSNQAALFSNVKPFNNRISLQNRNDLQFLPRYNTQNLMNNFNVMYNSDETGKIKVSQEQEPINNLKNNLSQTLNNKSEFYLKKRIFQHMTNKFENLHFQEANNLKLKRNKSHEQKDLKVLAEESKDFKKKGFQDSNHSNAQCPENANQKVINGGYQIKVTLVQSQKQLIT